MPEAEFRSLLERASPVVYADDVIKYATPQSVKIQNREHRDYSRLFMEERRLQQGVRFLREYEGVLRAAEARHGVSPADIVSILMWESRLGEVVGDRKVFNVFLGQLLYLDEGRRIAVDRIRREKKSAGAQLTLTKAERARLERIGRRATANLVALLRVSKERGADPLAQVGSWGGAIGFVQFMPQSLRYAVDGDGDGRIDLNSFPDAVFSVANYLRAYGYGSDPVARRKGIFGYNHIDSYVDGVIRYADAISELSRGPRP